MRRSVRAAMLLVAALATQVATAVSPEVAMLRAELDRLVSAVHDETWGRDAVTGALIDPIADEQARWQRETFARCTTDDSRVRALRERMARLRRDWADALH